MGNTRRERKKRQTRDHNKLFGEIEGLVYDFDKNKHLTREEILQEHPDNSVIEGEGGESG